MSAPEILAEIPKLTTAERDEIRRKLAELDGYDSPLTEEEIALIDSRLAEHQDNAQSAIPWAEFKSSLEEKLRK